MVLFLWRALAYTDHFPGASAYLGTPQPVEWEWRVDSNLLRCQNYLGTRKAVNATFRKYSYFTNISAVYRILQHGRVAYHCKCPIKEWRFQHLIYFYALELTSYFRISLGKQFKEEEVVVGV